MAGGYAGWALSTSAKTLHQVLPLCPSEARVVAWVKPIGVSSLTYGMHNTWEPVIIYGGRQRRPGIRDWFSAQPAKLGGHDLMGRKPDTFCQEVFNRLGMQPGDVLDDLFPGSGAVMRSWKAVGGCPGDGVWNPSLAAVNDGPSSTAAVNDAASLTDLQTPVSPSARGDNDRRRWWPHATPSSSTSATKPRRACTNDSVAELQERRLTDKRVAEP